MKWTATTFAALAATAIGAFAPTSVSAQEQLTIVANTYRTGAFSGSGIPLADGRRDYFAMLNARDGGIGGVRIALEECETQYDTRRSVECWEQAKAKGSIVYVPWSTGASLATIPRAHVDKIPIFSMAYGLSASAVGSTFPWVFNPPATYWDGASVWIQYIAQREGGLEKLRGKTVGLLLLDAPFGREPIPVLEAMARQYGFNLKLYPVPPAEMQNQASTWLAIRRDRTDWVLIQGWGAMNPTAVREAGRAGFPRDKVIGIWWAGGDDDARPSGAEGRGYLSLTWHQVGTNFPMIQDIIKHVVDRGQSLGPKEKVGESLYNRGIYEAMVLAEAIRNAQRLTGKRVITGEDMRRGLEALDITAARWAELGAPDFAAPMKVSCDDHNGHNAAFMQQWDGTKWVRASPWIAPDRALVRPLLEEAARAYAGSNAGWPARSEPCDQRS
ncbi:MAG: ABC transporter substrate-binding protein [Alphaproteobacteria bacterium]